MSKRLIGRLAAASLVWCAAACAAGLGCQAQARALDALARRIEGRITGGQADGNSLIG